jgi:hypothetical protein
MTRLSSRSRVGAVAEKENGRSPSARSGDLKLSLEQNVLTIQGRYGYLLPEEEDRQITRYRQEIGQGRFVESISLPVPVNAGGRFKPPWKTAS